MAEYGKALSGALRFCAQPKRWLPLFGLDAIFFAAVASYVLSNAAALKDFLAAASAESQGFAMAQSIVNLAVLVFFAFVAWSLIRLFVVGSLIHQSVKPKDELKKSCKVAKERYLSLLAVTIVVGLLSTIVGMVPYMGWVISIVVGLMFFFVMPAVVVTKLSFDDALRESFRLFKDRFTEVLVSWLLITIFSGIIVIIFMIPMFIISFNVLVPQLVGLQGATEAEVFPVLLNAGWSILPGAFVAIVGFAIGTAFSTNAQTSLYTQIRKKKGIL